MYQEGNTKTAFHPQASPPPVQKYIPVWVWVILVLLLLLVIAIGIGLAGSLVYYNGQVKDQSATAAALNVKLTGEVESVQTAEADAAAVQAGAQTQQAEILETVTSLANENAGLSNTLTAVAPTAIPPTSTSIPPTPTIPEPTRVALPNFRYIFRADSGVNNVIFLDDLGNPDATELASLAGNLSGLSWSPDGNRIAFLSNDTGAYDIYVMNADGSNLQNITQSSNVDGDPFWSPDSSKLLFSGLPGSTYEIYTIPAEGGELTNLTQNAYNDYEPAWSPDGQWVVYCSDHNLDELFNLYIVDAKGNNRRTLTTEGETNDRNPVFSPDGNWVAYNSDDGDWDIVLVNVNDKTRINLTEDSAVDDWSPAWSPDGLQIAFVSMTDGSNADIYVMNMDGSNRRRLTNNAVWNWRPEWSPDGQYIVFETDIDGNWELYLTDLYGGILVNLSQSPGTIDGELSWMP